MQVHRLDAAVRSCASFKHNKTKSPNLCVSVLQCSTLCDKLLQLGVSLFHLIFPNLRSFPSEDSDTNSPSNALVAESPLTLVPTSCALVGIATRCAFVPPNPPVHPTGSSLQRRSGSGNTEKPNTLLSDEAARSRISM